MPKVPCLMCLNLTDSDEDKAIATICPNCLKDENLTNFLKNLDYKQLKSILEDTKPKKINEYGEIL